jgi:hypothetical protein
MVRTPVEGVSISPPKFLDWLWGPIKLSIQEVPGLFPYGTVSARASDHWLQYSAEKIYTLTVWCSLNLCRLDNSTVFTSKNYEISETLSNVYKTLLGHSLKME